MFDNTIQIKLKKIFDKPVYQFFIMQLSFWLFICLVSLFTLTLWYGQADWVYIGHMLLQALMGLILSIPLYLILVSIWQKTLTTRVVSSILLVLLISFLWTLLRIQTFIFMTAEENIWADFGGWYFGSIFIFFCWIGLFYLTMYYKLLQFEHSVTLKAQAQAQKEQIKSMKAQAIAKDAQMKMLRYQLNPHFLYNTLNAMNALIEFKQADKAQSVIIKLSKFLRYSLESNPDIQTTITEECSMLTLYLDIEKARFGERLRFDFIIEEQAKSAKIPSMLLQPIVENSMKHVIAKNEDGGSISISGKVIDHKLVVEITDSGSNEKIDIDKLTSGRSSGIGLHNIKNRLNVIYDNNYTFNMAVTDAGALKTTIEIPCQYQSKNANTSTNHDMQGLRV